MKASSFVLTLGVCLSYAFAWTSDSLPDPQSNSDQCGRSVKGFVCSPDSLVDSTFLDVVQGHINAIYDGTDPYRKPFCPAINNYVNVEVLAVVVGKVDGSGEASKRVEQFTRGIHDRFGVGSKECGSGVAITISVEDRQVYISTGALVQKILPTQIIEEIVNSVKPKLRDGKYGQALEMLVVQVGVAIADLVDCAKTGSCEEGDTTPSMNWLIMSVFLIVAGIFGVKGHYDSRRRRVVSSNLRKLQKDLKGGVAVQASKEGNYISTSCPICLEDFTAPEDAPLQPPATTAPGALSAGASDLPASELTPITPSDDPPADTSQASRSPGPDDASEAAPLLPDRRTASDAAPVSRDNGAKCSGSVGAKKDAKMLFMLPCGHSFCEVCIMDWIKKKPECPVCRKPVSGEETGAGISAAAQPGSPGTSSSQQRSRPSSLRAWPSRSSASYGLFRLGYDGFGPELAFRLHRLRDRHRGYLTQEVVDDLLWEAGGRRGRRPGSRGQRTVGDWGSHPDVLRQMDEATWQSRARSGAGGSGGRSFGGGRSSGGGGGGW